jgi:protoporphyrin/coproporphyrin ferrochelatase
MIRAIVNGLLLVNLGTPDAPESRAVRRYLRQFLSDPRVIDMNAFGRWLLLEFAILPFRPRKSAAAYRAIWTERGSPLLVNSLELAAAVRARLGDGWKVAVGMRYGAPSIASALEELRASERIVALPLYPQNASSSTGSSVDEVTRVAEALELPPPVFVPPFWNDDGFVAAFAGVGEAAARAADHVLFSFHGVPERHVRAADPSGAWCLQSATCCDAIGDANRDCYRAQCYATARAIAARLGLAADAWSVAFQSRLGRTPWIRPYTDVVLPELAQRGIKRVAVFCPAFVADCLETLEEIGLRGRESFVAAARAAGHTDADLALVPSLNADPRWADAVAALARRHGKL